MIEQSDKTEFLKAAPEKKLDIVVNTTVKN